MFIEIIIVIISLRFHKNVKHSSLKKTTILSTTEVISLHFVEHY